MGVLKDRKHDGILRFFKKQLQVFFIDCRQFSTRCSFRIFTGRGVSIGLSCSPFFSLSECINEKNTEETQVCHPSGFIARTRKKTRINVVARTMRASRHAAIPLFLCFYLRTCFIVLFYELNHTPICS